MTVYLVLGAKGFIGSHLVDRFANLDFPVYLYNRWDRTVVEYLTNKKESLEQFIENKESIEVVNCLAAWGAQLESKLIKEAKYELPISIFKLIANHKNVRLWVQLSSYYYFYYLNTGIDKNEYSFWKRQMSNDLKIFSSQIIKSNNLKILDVYIPHIYGERAKRERLVGLMLKYANSNTVLKLTSGKQILPLLHIEDCVSGIISLMNNLDGQECYITRIFWNIGVGARRHFERRINKNAYLRIRQSTQIRRILLHRMRSWSKMCGRASDRYIESQNASFTIFIVNISIYRIVIHYCIYYQKKSVLYQFFTQNNSRSTTARGKRSTAEVRSIRL